MNLVQTKRSRRLPIHTGQQAVPNSTRQPRNRQCSRRTQAHKVISIHDNKKKQKEIAIKNSILLRNPKLSTWHPGRVSNLTEIVSKYISSNIVSVSSRIAVQLLFGRRGVVEM